MRGISALLAIAGISAAWHDTGRNMMPSGGMIQSLPNKYERVGKGVAQAKREAIKLRRRKAHRMHCRGSAS
ncbi:MAG TPA: hypothetical protein P5195_04380 [Anaerolineae bacterium]|jgi:hypothetical protein|nr:hypothetical protein [Anaerolineae bacterium]